MKYTIERLGNIASVYTTYKISKPFAKHLFKGGALNCQKEINAQIDNPNTTLIQNIPNKGIATILGKIPSKTVIIKVQPTNEATSEYNMNRILNNTSLKGFVVFECFATCDGSKQHIEELNVVQNSKLCTKKGTSMGIIIMPFYENGSLESAMKQTKINSEQLCEIILEVISNYYIAFVKTGFLHRDFFSKNIVLDKNNKPFIIDFEKSKFDKNAYTNFWRDLDSFLNDIAFVKPEYEKHVNGICRELYFHMAYSKEPSDKLMRSLYDMIKTCFMG